MSVYSMTGFAYLQVQTSLGLLGIELKSVNSRYLEVNQRIPEELRFFEGDIRQAITKAIARGKVDCRMQWVGESELEQTINAKTVENLLKVQQEVLSVCTDAKPLTVSNILQFPGVLKPVTINEDALKSIVMDALCKTLATLLEARKREGEALAVVINGYCDQIEAIVGELAPKLPLIIESIESKLQDRLSEALSRSLLENSTLSKEEVIDRIRQEVTLYAIKLDVDEEMNRLLTHVKEVRRLLVAEGEIGKKLDFLMQELNREANTLGSKAAAIEMTQTSLALKVTIEKMREQVQNLE